MFPSLTHAARVLLLLYVLWLVLGYSGYGSVCSLKEMGQCVGYRGFASGSVCFEERVKLPHSWPNGPQRAPVLWTKTIRFKTRENPQPPSPYGRSQTATEGWTCLKAMENNDPGRKRQEFDPILLYYYCNNHSQKAIVVIFLFVFVWKWNTSKWSFWYKLNWQRTVLF